MSCACAIEIEHEEESEMIFEKDLTIFKNQQDAASVGWN